MPRRPRLPAREDPRAAAAACAVSSPQAGIIRKTGAGGGCDAGSAVRIRGQGLHAGADYYLGKGSFQDQSLLDAVADLIGEPEA